MIDRRVVSHLDKLTGPLVELWDHGNSGPLLRDRATDIYLPAAEQKILSPLEVLRLAIQATESDEIKKNLNKQWTTALYVAGAVKKLSETAGSLGKFRERSQAGEAVREAAQFVIGAALHLETPDFTEFPFSPRADIKDVVVTERTPEEMAEYVAKHEGSYNILRPIMSDYWRRELPKICAGSAPITAAC